MFLGTVIYCKALCVQAKDEAIKQLQSALQAKDRALSRLAYDGNDDAPRTTGIQLKDENSKSIELVQVRGLHFFYSSFSFWSMTYFEKALSASVKIVIYGVDGCAKCESILRGCIYFLSLKNCI